MQRQPVHRTVLIVLVIAFGAITNAAPVTWTAVSGPLAGGALAGEKPRVIVSTDVGGSDPDDFQSMVHLLIYADVFDIEGLISSPPGKGRKQHILETLDTYEKDYAKLKQHSGDYPKPDVLRAVTKQGAIEAAPKQGTSQATEGSRWIVGRARQSGSATPDARPLYVLVWGSITDVAQAVHDAPDIKRSIRVYSIGSWNTRNDKAARDYLYEHHPGLWWIESDTTFRGMYIGGPQQGDLGNASFVMEHVRGHGALGELFWQKKRDIKMGDSPSVLYLLRGDPSRPTGDHWGGAYVRTTSRASYWHDNPDPRWREGDRDGAKSVNRWRQDYLADWKMRMDRTR